ncbi:hypothetical protein EPN87_01995 [archaeon]|nr:MAG: hypothetical protein EPN87_01995 [archaeon]
MEKQELIRKFLSLGCMVDQDALQAMVDNPSVADRALQMITSGQKVQTITLQWLNHQPVTIIQTFNKINGSITPDDVIRSVQKRYDSMRETLSKQMQNMLSINKISPKTRNFSLISMIKENNGNSILVEDDTGEARLSLKKELSDKSKFLVEDEVVGLECEQAEGIVVGNIVWPDIPLGRIVAKADSSCIFAANVPDGKPFDSEYVFSFGNPTNSKAFFITNTPAVNTFPDPCMVRIGDVKILFLSCTEYTKTWDVAPEVACLNLLKKRSLDPRINLASADMSLSDIPDLIVCPTSGEPAVLNYKGTTIISTSYPVCWSANLKTRETFKISMA